MNLYIKRVMKKYIRVVEVYKAVFFVVVQKLYFSFEIML